LLTPAEAEEAWPSYGELPEARKVSVLAAADGLIEQVVGYPMGLTTYRHAEQPGRSRRARLRGRPVVSVDRVAADWTAALAIVNTSPNHQRAFVTFAANAWTFTSVTAGISTTATIDLTGLPTLTDVAAAITALGEGWSATVESALDLWPSAVLAPPAGTFGALGGGVSVGLYARDLREWDLVEDRGWPEVELYESFADAPAWPTRRVGIARSSRAASVWLEYRAGYATADVPAIIKDAARLAVKVLSEKIRATGIFKSEALGVRSYTLSDIDGAAQATLRDLLSDYQRIEVI
jgi:hypothetical protein